MLTATRHPNVVQPGQGQGWWLVGDEIRFKLTSDQTDSAFTLAETRVPPGGGPPPHIHHREHEIFYLLEGQLRLGMGERAVVRGPGSAIFLPRDIIHTFKCISATPARFILLAQPGGFERMVTTCGEPLATLAPDRQICGADIGKLLSICGNFGLEIRPEWQFTDVEAPPPTPPQFWVLGQHVTIKLSTAQTQGALTLAEVRSTPGTGVPAHLHRAMDEIFCVLEGTYRFNVDGQPVDAGPGTVVHVPPGVLHSFANAGPTRAIMLDYHLPGGFDAFFEECGTPCESCDSTPPDMKPDKEWLMGLFQRHGMEIPGAE